MSATRAQTRVSKIERVDRALSPTVVRVRLRDGHTIRIDKGTADFVMRTAGRLTSGQIAYNVDDAGNCFNPRVATDAERALATAATEGP